MSKDDHLLPGEYYVAPIEIKNPYKSYKLRVYFGPKGFRMVVDYPDGGTVGGWATYDVHGLAHEIERLLGSAVARLALDLNFARAEALELEAAV